MFGPSPLLQMSASVVRKPHKFYLLKNKLHISLVVWVNGLNLRVVLLVVALGVKGVCQKLVVE